VFSFVQLLVAIFAVMLVPAAAHAKVVSQSATGFSLMFQADVPGDTQSAYEKFVSIGSWWDASHSHSGDSKNLSMDVKNGGCWCETLPNGGFVRHMEIVHAAPGETLVLSGGLGPLAFMGVSGAMAIRFQKMYHMTRVTMEYSVGGFDAAGFKGMAKAVDGVLDIGFKRYSNFVSTGQP